MYKRQIEISRNEISVGRNYKIDDFSKLSGIKRRAPQRTGSQAQKGNKENPLFASGGAMTLRCEYSYNHSSMLIRKIQEAFTQATKDVYKRQLLQRGEPCRA